MEAVTITTPITVKDLIGFLSKANQDAVIFISDSNFKKATVIKCLGLGSLLVFASMQDGGVTNGFVLVPASEYISLETGQKNIDNFEGSIH